MYQQSNVAKLEMLQTQVLPLLVRGIDLAQLHRRQTRVMRVHTIKLLYNLH
jgi:hypothetical protein